MSKETKNWTTNREFHILAFSNHAELKYVIFIGVLLMYIITFLGNLVIISLICMVSQLHTPMYFFLCNLSVQDIIYVSSILPKMLTITITGDTNIDFSLCITQMFLFMVCIVTEYLLLTSMAYDRYVAICISLHYSLMMNKRTCVLLATASWLIGILTSVMYSSIVSTLSFCKSQEINHFFCDLKAILNLSCSDITHIHTIIYIVAVFLGVIPFLMILSSYVNIISTIIKIKNTAGKLKIFSSCSSHLTVVILFSVSPIIVYLKKDSEGFQEPDKVLSLIYIAVIPMLNPLVYSLRNQDVLNALKKASGKILLMTIHLLLDSDCCKK
ncbi:olfactory receptor 1G1-like [Spea bombifrons]|uniref:olfactory receptor 1G1-like n=1 Tax=Spea bombifrons TaxID=233779 RepID=UPI00234A3AC0|nr:olfactory receptor 1G1-like [Spea bombifrons]